MYDCLHADGPPMDKATGEIRVDHYVVKLDENQIKYLENHIRDWNYIFLNEHQYKNIRA